jgi:hypothetical protein
MDAVGAEERVVAAPRPLQRDHRRGSVPLDARTAAQIVAEPVTTVSPSSNAGTSPRGLTRRSSPRCAPRSISTVSNSAPFSYSAIRTLRTKGLRELA